MAGMYLLGIDVGTSGAKAAVIQKDGTLIGLSAQEYPILIPRKGWAEQDPEEWLAVVSACILDAMDVAGISPAEISCIGIAGQMHSLVCLDQQKNPLRPAILWADQRSAGQVKRLSQEIGKENLALYTGNPLAAGFMMASWAWLCENDPQTAARTRLLLLPKDYVRFRMTGVVGSEPSDASSTLLFDPHRREWSPEMLAYAGLSMEMLPPIHPSEAIAGKLSAEMAASTGLVQGTPVIMGGSDVSLQALAQGIINPGTVSCTIGTGGQIFAPLATPRHDPDLRLHLFCHVVPNTWHQEAAILTAGLALRWLRDGLWPGETYQILADQASAVEAAVEGLFFLPYLAGERTPHMDPGLSASFIGLELGHQRPHFIRAVMEGVVFALKHGLGLMESLGTPIDRLILTGGGTRHPLWLQLQADIFNRPVFISEIQEATARGAAVLAGVGIGVYANAADGIVNTVREPVPGAVPDPSRTMKYQAAFEEYTSLADIITHREKFSPITA
ncbi:MAG: xylulokinase [Anaerolineaceae bacterium]|nr:xylulokinase [Anaerolineaceae bacterium]